jgi:chromosomal replication initiation ATPase DnaA
MSRPRGQLALDLPHLPALGREDFLVAPCNEAAVAWIDRWPGWPGPALALAGPGGCGKTHLAHVWRVRSGAAMIAGRAVTGETDILLAGASHAVVDDAAVADPESLLHLYNHLAAHGGSLLLTAREAPARWGLRLADLDSRLRAAPVAAIGAPDDALMEAVMVKLFADRQIAVGREVIAYMLARMERSFDAARRTVAALDRMALAERRTVTVPLARRVLEGDG